MIKLYDMIGSGQSWMTSRYMASSWETAWIMMFVMR